MRGTVLVANCYDNNYDGYAENHDGYAGNHDGYKEIDCYDSYAAPS